MSKSSLIVGLDIGTTKICAVVGKLFDSDQLKMTESDKIEILGIVLCTSTGLRNGVVVDIEKTVQSIRTAIERAELMAGCKIGEVYVGIAGRHISSINSPGMVTVKGGEIGQGDIERVLDSAKTMSIPADREVIHIIPQEYIVDNQRGIANPIGMAGIRLQVNVHIVTGAVTSVQNIMRSCHHSQIEVADIALESLASAKAVLTPEEREIGVALVDIGGGTTDIAIFANNSIKYTEVLALGGQNLSNDIAFGLRTPIASAEKIKIKYSCAMMDLVHNDEVILVPSVGGRQPRKISRMALAQICEPRMDEILCLVDQSLERSGIKHMLGAGVVLTGGTSLIEGCQELGEQIFKTSTRIGAPRNVEGLKDMVNSPSYATAVGLLRYGMEKELSGQKKFTTHDDTQIFVGLIERMKKWFSEVF